MRNMTWINKSPGIRSGTVFFKCVGLDGRDGMNHLEPGG